MAMKIYLPGKLRMWSVSCTRDGPIGYATNLQYTCSLLGAVHCWKCIPLPQYNIPIPRIMTPFFGLPWVFLISSRFFFHFCFLSSSFFYYNKTFRFILIWIANSPARTTPKTSIVVASRFHVNWISSEAWTRDRSRVVDAINTPIPILWHHFDQNF